MSFLKFIFTFFFAFLFTVGSAQTFSAKVFDKDTGEAIPYATIETGKNQGLITNEEGEFTFQLDQLVCSFDSLPATLLWLRLTTCTQPVRSSVYSLIHASGGITLERKPTSPCIQLG